MGKITSAFECDLFFRLVKPDTKTTPLPIQKQKKNVQISVEKHTPEFLELWENVKQIEKNQKYLTFADYF